METKGNIDNEVPNIHSEHVKEEFYKWFESRGLLSDLRAYMRQLMVKALEESNKNGKTVLQTKAATSPKLQAINLLVVDYLFHEDYLYTVSVFASEAQILDSLPQYSSYVTQTVRERRWEPSSLPRFSQQETDDILDTLRLPPTRQGARRATQLYLSGHESLFTCIVRTLASSGMDQDPARADEGNMEQLSTECIHQLWSQEMQDLLLLAGVKLQHIRRMQHKWAQIIEDERTKVRQEEEAQRVDWEQEAEQRVRGEVVEQLRAEQQQLRDQQNRVERREQGLTSLAEHLTTFHDDITVRLSQLQSQREELQVREEQIETNREQLEKRFSQLLVREEGLENAIASFQEQVVATTSLDERVEQASNSEITRDVSIQVTSVEVVPVVAVHTQTQTTDPAVAAYTQTVDSVDHEQQTSRGSEPDPQLLIQLQTDRQKISELQEENLELRTHALQQRHRIDTLTNRAASLSSQLEDSQVALALLSGRESGVVVAPPPPAPLAQSAPHFIAPTFGYNSPQRIGAGEESLFTPRSQQATSRPDGRKRPLRFAFSQNQNPTSEESSPTDEIVQNARTRIQQLEEESAAVQRNYHAFQARLMSSDSMMFPPLGSSALRTNNTQVRMRTNNIMPLLSFSNVPYPTNSTNYRSTLRGMPDEENEDSSSDQTALYESGRLEHMTHSRRMFTQRNMRQFERWKQFKKKFQRRDTLDQCRRNFRVPHSNTSSEDEGDLRNARRRQEVIYHSKLHTVQQGETQIPNTIEVEKEQELKIIHVHSINEESREGNKSEGKVSSIIAPKNDEETVQSEMIVAASKVKLTEEDKSKLYADEQSVKLIESVRILLEAQNMNPASTLSNGSLAVESLPRDSKSGSQNEIAFSDNSSLPTVQRLLPVSQIDAIDKIGSKEGNVDSIARVGQERLSMHEYKSDTVRNEDITSRPIKHSQLEIDDEGVLDVEETIPLPLSVPTSRLANVPEDLIDTNPVTLSEVAEHESGDKGTTSVTSGSDILRELNPSNTESSDSVISTGLGDISKHSSDFWN
uniref:Uncharacterized protein n=1 Tax=Graphocephala atropunctata TaxID=36148 RepID=A0A1B6L552_9HEMI